MSARVDLEDLAFSALAYEMSPGHKVRRPRPPCFPPNATPAAPPSPPTAPWLRHFRRRCVSVGGWLVVGQVSELTKEDQYFISDEYKREVIEKMSVSQLVDTVMTNPTVRCPGAL